MTASIRWSGSNGLRILAQGAAVREARLLARDELEQRRLPVLGGLARAGKRAGDVVGLLDALAPAAHGPTQIRVAPADVTGAVLVVRDDQMRDLDGHGRVVEDDGENRNPAAHRRLEIEPGHAEGGVAHEVDAELVRGGELGADHEAEPGAQRVRLAPAEIAARRHGAVERQQLDAWAAGVVSDNGVARIDRALELDVDSSGIDRDVLRAERRRPFGEPRRAHALEVGTHVLSAGRAAALTLQSLDELAQHESRVAQQWVVGRVVLVEVALVVGGVD